jgi:hypothetical protein
MNPELTPDPAKAAPRHSFTPEEDRRLRSLVARLGTRNWDDIVRYFPGHTARQCHDRDKNYLTDSLTIRPWTPEEDAFLIEKFHQIGPKWVQIGKLLSGRSGNNVKNRWHKHLCRLQSGNAQSPAGQKRALDLGRAIGWRDQDWCALFSSAENSVSLAGESQ